MRKIITKNLLVLIISSLLYFLICLIYYAIINEARTSKEEFAYIFLAYFVVYVQYFLYYFGLIIIINLNYKFEFLKIRVFYFLTLVLAYFLFLYYYQETMYDWDYFGIILFLVSLISIIFFLTKIYIKPIYIHKHE